MSTSNFFKVPCETPDVRLCIQYASVMLGARLRRHSVKPRLLVRVILLFGWSHAWWLITWWERNYVAPQDTEESVRGLPWMRGPAGAVLQHVISVCSWHYANKVHHIPCSTCNANTVTHNLRLWADSTILYEYGLRCNEDLSAVFSGPLLCSLLLASW